MNTVTKKRNKHLECEVGTVRVFYYINVNRH